MPLYDPDIIPHQLEINNRIAKIEALGINVTPQQRVAIENMTRRQIADYIKGLLK
jgi:hypothetical protein